MTSRQSGLERPDRRRALALAAAGAIAGCAPAPPVSARGEAARGRGGSIEVDGVPVYYETLGSGPPVVLVHGASGNLRDWTLGAAQAIAARNTVIAFDRPGHGLSGWPDAGGDRLGVQADLLRGALRQLGISRTRLVGHSYGGSVALAWAVSAPESVSGALLISAPSQVWQGGLGLTTEVLAAPVIGPLVARAAPAVVSDGFTRNAVAGVFAPQSAPEGYFDHLRRELILQPDTLRRNALQLAVLKEDVRAMVPRYPALGVPVEILHGSADVTVPIEIHSEPLSRQVPRGRLTTLPGIGHMPHHVALSAVLEALDRLET